ncbi:TlyA family RNA methyltransferase [Vagococcus elongatus]|uniref:TlyA family rRNA (Cytidine-2'-O)-methyltransferase n=1 Tax=Vagococcus elongatus TaxID=180344 RepID=A0A430AYI4_9ENTE|nr:TlyA family RNA methyltransferase [Vagococcus elongatus]RSU13131.1 TlyA family rRNA (cytidine-2'-O)-methyltransferase [Vagococcus elongatus]
MKKERVDVLVVAQGLCDTREQAKRSVMAGLVYDENNERMDKPGMKIPEHTKLQLKGSRLPYVSRGGLKLEKAIEVFDIEMADKILLDIGASTGGFTDVSLQNGAKLSYALDVGYNQLAWKLRQDERVVVMEKTNFRYAKPEDFTKGVPDIATIDVSFISLKLILPVLKTILKEQGEVVCLVKPQFEAGREFVGKNGIIRDKEVHEMVLFQLLSFMQEAGYEIQGVSYSPIRGGEGNIEFLAYLINSKQPKIKPESSIKELSQEIVAKAHQSL